MSKPTHGSVKESIEVVWEAIHQWTDDLALCHPEDREPNEDDVKLSMNIIMDNLGFTFDKNGDVTQDTNNTVIDDLFPDAEADGTCNNKQ
jgi:hypothetical protein